MATRLSLSEAEEQVPPEPRQGPNCTLTTILASLDAEDAERLRSWLSDPEMTHRRISRILRAAGYNLSDYTVGRHRRGDCQCLRS